MRKPDRDVTGDASMDSQPAESQPAAADAQPTRAEAPTDVPGVAPFAGHPGDSRAAQPGDGRGEAPPDFIVRDRRFWATDHAQAPGGPEGGARGESADATPAAGKAGEAPPAEKLLEQKRAAEKRVEEQAAIIQQLENKIASQAGEVLAVRTQYHRALEEFEKAQARLGRDAKKETERNREGILASFLDVADNLDRAIDAARGAANVAAVVEGVELVRQSFLAALKSFGVTPMDADGHPFDPTRHEAIAFVPVDHPDKNKTVVGVAKKGYLLGDNTLRAAAVAVGNWESPASSPTDTIPNDTIPSDTVEPNDTMDDGDSAVERQ